MTKVLIRHGLSEANNRDNYGTPAFGNPNSPLMPQGREQARELGRLLVVKYGIDLATEPVAVSELLRSQETAFEAGFRVINIYPELNEEKGGLDDDEVRKALLNRNPPDKTIEAACHLIESPLYERFWVMHAFVIGTICQQLGVYQDTRFIPKFGEPREVPLY